MTSVIALRCPAATDAGVARSLPVASAASCYVLVLFPSCARPNPLSQYERSSGVFLLILSNISVQRLPLPAAAIAAKTQR